jgi:DNA-binding transcriptional MocR family regulator
LQAIESLGMRALEIATCPGDGMDVDALRSALQTAPRCGRAVDHELPEPARVIMPEDKKRAMVELLARHDVPLIEDDIFGDLAYEPPAAARVQGVRRQGLVLLCSSYSKTLAPGARVGGSRRVPRYRERLECLKICTTLATPTLPQMAIAAFLASGA